MSRFVDTAMEILETAEKVARTGEAPSQLTFLISPEGGLRIVADSDWPLDSLQREHGAQVAYRLSPAGGSIRVDGREGSRSCHLEAAVPERTARFLLNAAPSWLSYSRPLLAA